MIRRIMLRRATPNHTMRIPATNWHLLTVLSLASLFLASAGLVSAPLAAAQTTDWHQITIPPLPTFHPKEPKRIALPNGMVIFLQEDKELPLIDGVARIRGGSRSEPAVKTGMLDIYGEVWRTGGTKSQTGDALDDFLEIRAAKVETGNNADSTEISWSCLKGDFDDVFKVVTDLLHTPEFREDKIDLAKQEAADSISRRNDQVAGIASREALKLAYGAQNPYARDAEYATVAAVNRQDLLDWYAKHVQPNNIILGVVGDFDASAMEAKLRQAFGSWPKGPAADSPKIQFTPAKPGYYLIPKPDVNQSNIRMVELGTRRDNPDYYALQVFNEVFGGGFSARLVQSIRTAKGLAYSVGGGVGTAFDHPGIVRLSMGTKSGSTVEAIQALYDEIDNLATKPISADEIKRAKDAILNSFVFNFDSPDKILRERMAYEFYGYPADFLERFQAGVEKVTTADVARVIPKYLHKDQLAVLVVGNTSEFDKPLSSLGPVTNIDITIPPPPAEKSEASAPPAASNAEGKALASKVAQAMGGEAKLQSIKALRAEFSVTQKTPQGDVPLTMRSTIIFPDHMHVDAQGPMGAFTLVVSPAASFVSAAGMGVRDLPESQKIDTLMQIKRDMIYLGQNLGNPSFTFAASGKEKIGNVEAGIVDISGDGIAMRWYVDPQSGHVLRESYQGAGRSGPVQDLTDLDDWKTTDGLTLPFLHKNKQNGEDASTIQFNSIQINPTVDSTLFDKPASEAKATP
jgi:zinc protease